MSCEVNIEDPSEKNNALSTEQAFLLQKPKITGKEKQIQSVLCTYTQLWKTATTFSLSAEDP